MNEQATLNDRLREAAKLGDVAALEQALEDGAEARAQDSWALSLAASNGHVECVRRLISVSDPLADGSGALRGAAQCGHADCVKVLMEASDPLAQNSYALRAAASGGHADCLGLLMGVSEPKAQNFQALRWAAVNGHADCVALLLPASDPLAAGIGGVDAADLARSRGHMEVAGMIEAFMEAGELSGSIAGVKMRAKEKKAL
jgi:ankyrin repeat protein